MSTSPMIVRKAAVLGAGVMGAQIAAHLVNCNVPVILFDLPAKEGDPRSARRTAPRTSASPITRPGSPGSPIATW